MYWRCPFKVMVSMKSHASRASRSSAEAFQRGGGTAALVLVAGLGGDRQRQPVPLRRLAVPAHGAQRLTDRVEDARLTVPVLGRLEDFERLLQVPQGLVEFRLTAQSGAEVAQRGRFPVTVLDLAEQAQRLAQFTATASVSSPSEL